MLDEHGDNIEEADPSRPGDGARSHRRAGRRRELHRGRRRPHGPPDRREARGARARGHAGQASRASYPRGLHGLHGEGREPGAQPHPQGRRVRFGRGPRGLAAPRSTSATRSASGSSTAVSVRSPRPTSTWRRPPTPSSSASTSARRARRPRWPTARASRSGTTRSSTRRSRRSRRPSRACSSRSTRRSTLGKAEIREIFRSSKLGNIAGCMVTSGDDPAQRQGAAAPRRQRSSRTTSTSSSLRREKDDVTEVREGFECGLMLRELQRHQEGDVVETLRDARDPARLITDADPSGRCRAPGPSWRTQRADRRSLTITVATDAQNEEDSSGKPHGSARSRTGSRSSSRRCWSGGSRTRGSGS